MGLCVFVVWGPPLLLLRRLRNVAVWGFSIIIWSSEYSRTIEDDIVGRGAENYCGDLYWG